MEQVLHETRERPETVEYLGDLLRMRKVSMDHEVSSAHYMWCVAHMSELTVCFGCILFVQVVMQVRTVQSLSLYL